MPSLLEQNRIEHNLNFISTQSVEVDAIIQNI